MADNRDECNQFIQMAVGNYKKNNFLVAWKYSLRAYELQQTPQIYRLVTTIKSSLLKAQADSSYSDSSSTNTSYANKSYPNTSYSNKSYANTSYPDTSYKDDDCSDDSSSKQTTIMSNGSCESSNSANNSEETTKKSKRRRESNDFCGETYNGNDCSSERTTKKAKQSNESSESYSNTTINENIKDESYKCLKKAETYIQCKQLDLAEKLVLKSMKLFHLSQADELYEQIQEIKEKDKPKYTEAQANIVEKVRYSEDFYAMLDIDCTANELEIKKAYKKLALILHPDKNPAPGSGKVFADVTSAVEILCDPTKRRNYDRSLKKSIFKFGDSCTQETNADDSDSSHSSGSSFFYHPYHPCDPTGDGDYDDYQYSSEFDIVSD